MTPAQLEALCQKGVATTEIDETTARATVLGSYPMLVDRRDKSLAPHFMQRGYWESWITAVVIAELRRRGPGARFADIGANVGWYSLVAHAAGAELAVAVEPSPRCAELLARTFAENGLDVPVITEAAWSESGTRLQLEQDPTNFGGMSVMADRCERVPVLTTTIDELADHFGPFDVVKIDIEGAEMEAWRGMQRALAHPGTVVFMEFTPESHADAVAELRSIESAGFDLQIICADGSLAPMKAQEASACPKGEWMMLRISQRRPKHRRANGKPRLLWVADSPTIHTGFGRVTESVLRYLSDRFHVGVLGLHHDGNPHRFPYPIYRAGDDGFGFAAMAPVIEDFAPDAILILNDPYFVSKYQEMAEKRGIDVPMLAYMPVDSPHIEQGVAERVSKLSAAIFYTRFGLGEALKAGFHGFGAVIPHGIDAATFIPRPREESRRRSGLGFHRGDFIIGNVNRNQPRKRLDLAIAYFAEWVKRESVPEENVKLYLHCSTKDVGWRLEKLAAYFGIRGRLLLTARDLEWNRGIDEEALVDLYNSFDLQISTTLGEGWGLTTMEGMACGVPQIVPRWSALAEWPGEAVESVPCSSIDVYPGFSNGIGGVVDAEGFIAALSRLYRDRERRELLSAKGRALVERPEYRWEAIAGLFGDVIEKVLVDGSIEVSPKTEVGGAELRS